MPPARMLSFSTRADDLAIPTTTPPSSNTGRKGTYQDENAFATLEKDSPRNKGLGISIINSEMGICLSGLALVMGKDGEKRQRAESPTRSLEMLSLACGRTYSVSTQLGPDVATFGFDGDLTALAFTVLHPFTQSPLNYHFFNIFNFLISFCLPASNP